MCSSCLSLPQLRAQGRGSSWSGPPLAHAGFSCMLQPEAPFTSMLCFSPPYCCHSQELKAEARGQAAPSAHGGYSSAPQQLPQSATTPASSFSAGAGNSRPAAATAAGSYSRGAATADPYAAGGGDEWGAGGRRGQRAAAAGPAAVEEYGGSNVRGRGRPTAVDSYGKQGFGRQGCRE
jgi:hypothetical protein